VLGDNREHTGDSRQGWLVPRENISGRVGLAAAGEDYKISWELAVELIHGCHVELASTNHSGRAGIRLKSGGDLEIIDPVIKELWPEVAAAMRVCGNDSIGFANE
jgi:hypothetical protein